MFPKLISSAGISDEVSIEGCGGDFSKECSDPESDSSCESESEHDSESDSESESESESETCPERSPNHILRRSIRLLQGFNARENLCRMIRLCRAWIL